MSRDYKKPPKRSPGGSGFSAGSFVFGLLLGMLIGLGVALAVAWYVNKMPSPFVSRVPPKAEKPEPPKGGSAEPAKTDNATAAGKGGEEKRRFEFYDILQGAKEPGGEHPAKDDTAKAGTAAAKEAFYLQAGAFPNAQDADNLKARLALLGHEAAVQAAPLADKGTWYRVRLGPYASVEDLNRVRDALKQNGIDTTLVKARDAADAKPAK